MNNYRVIYKESHGHSENFEDNASLFVKYKGDPKIREIQVDTKKRAISDYLRTFFEQVFLPEGFPDNVNSDYIPYQIWDTIQAFASTIMGTLTTKAIMQGVGVGQTSATPLAAAITWILKDGTGMLGRIMFAWWKGSELDTRCKRWRLFADILNDAAMTIELTIPYFSTYSTYILCMSTTMKAIVGVAGGATRATLTQHQALQNNLADVSAKDGSQETLVNLVASFLGILILSYLPAEFSIHLFIFLVAVHIFANYSAVCALRLDSLNEDRTALIMKHYYTNNGKIPSLTIINKLESLVLFHNTTKNICGFTICMGVSLNKVMKDTTEKFQLPQFFRTRKYVPIINRKKKTIYVLLSKYARSDDIFEAFFHAFLYGWAVTLKLTKHEEPVIKIQSDAIVASSNRELITKTLENYVNDASETLDMDFPELNAIIYKEYNTFIQRLEKSEWTSQKSLSNVGPWRGLWD